MKNNQLKQTELKLKIHKHKDAMHDPKQPPHSIILRVISGLEWVEHIMDIINLAIQCIEPLIAVVVMFMLRHIKLMYLDEAISAIDRRKRAPFVGEWPPIVDCSVESTRKRSGRLLRMDSLSFSHGTHTLYLEP